MVERIIQIREMAKLSQEEFANRLGLSRNFINQVENGKKNFSDRTISDICSKIKIDGKTICKEWISSGNGNMFSPLTKNQEIGAFANEVMNLPDEAFKKRFVDALKKLDEKDWKNLEKITNKLLKED